MIHGQTTAVTTTAITAHCESQIRHTRGASRALITFAVLGEPVGALAMLSARPIVRSAIDAIG
jgi:hypothetical protein